MPVSNHSRRNPDTVTLFLCGDVMTGRGIDQILPHPGDPSLHEPFVSSAVEYVRLAEERNGPIPRPVDFDYVWGDALGEFHRVEPDLRLINLETAVTTSDDYDRFKQIHYRMHPANVSCLSAAGIQCCVLANNHVIDWGRHGLSETLEAIAQAGIAFAGAGRTLEDAARPAIFDLHRRGRVIVFACGCESAGVPARWCATPSRPGVWLVDEDASETVDRIASAVSKYKQPGDIAVLSIHWGGNWGYGIPQAQRQFAHAVIDRAGINVVHGHSSHHVKGIEVYREHPIIYGCGDFLTDYEGITGHEEYRDDLGLMYFVALDTTRGTLSQFEVVPTQLRRFQLVRPAPNDVAWLAATLTDQSRHFGTIVECTSDGGLILRWHT